MRKKAEGSLLSLIDSGVESWFNRFVSEVGLENSNSGDAVLRALEAAEIARFKAAAFNPALMSGGSVAICPPLVRKSDQAAYGRLKIRAYAHNRITLSASLGGRRLVGKRLKAADLRSAVKRRGFLDICSKTRRGFKIGGRWRNLPLKTTFTPAAQNFVRDAGYIIESSSAITPWFLTLTIPGEGSEINDVLSAGSGYLIDRFNRWMRYRVESGFFAYVWELQERGTPHIHYMFRADLGDDPGVFAGEVRSEWRKILLDVSAEADVDLFENADGYSWKDDDTKPFVDMREITTSVAGYLAKYASKTRSKANAKTNWHPGRWWGVSYPCRKEVLRRRLSVVLGLDTLDAATKSIAVVCDRLGSLVQSVFIPEHQNGFVDYFVSLVVSEGESKRIAKAICVYLVEGDATALDILVKRSDLKDVEAIREQEANDTT